MTDKKTPKTSKDWTVEEMLEDVLEGIKSGELKANKAIVLFLNDESGEYNTGFVQSGMSVSQCIALLETVKFDFFKGLERNGFEPENSPPPLIYSKKQSRPAPWRYPS